MKVIIEMPKGDDRRRHLQHDKSGFIDLGLIKEVIPVNNGLMPVNYGYIPETVNETEGDEIDVLVLSERILNIKEEIEVNPIALIKRADGDDKVVAVDETRGQTKTWADITEEERDLIISFFSYHSKIDVIESAEVANEYLQKARANFVKI